MFSTSMTWSDILFLLQGALVTISITAWAVAGGTILGILFGVMRAHGPIFLSLVIGAVLDVFRSVPLLIQLVLLNSFNSILKFNFSPFTVGCITLGIYTSAYCAEIVRGGIMAVPETTRRASRGLGLTYFQDLKYIVLPIASRVSLPSWIGLVLGVMKDTSLVLWIGIAELLRNSQTIVTRLQEPLFVLFIAGCIYFALSYPIARLGARLEKRWHTQ